jgi:hypothetical protein
MRALVFLLVLGWLAPAAAQPVPSKCNAAKYKAAGAYAQAIVACQAKAIQKGEGIDPGCLEKAGRKLQAGFEKAERKGDCNGSDGAETAQGIAIGFRIDLAGILPPQRCCALGGQICGWAADATACTGAGGTPGAEGSICDGESGLCELDAPASGPCCETDGLCTSGNVLVGDCTAGGGAFVNGGVCLETGECLAH